MYVVYCNFLLLASKEKLFGPRLFWDGDVTAPTLAQVNRGIPLGHLICMPTTCLFSPPLVYRDGAVCVWRAEKLMASKKVCWVFTVNCSGRDKEDETEN